MPRSSKHGHGRLVLTNTRRPWHGVPGCVCEVLTTARQSIVCGRTTSTTAQLLTAYSRGRRTVRSCGRLLVRPTLNCSPASPQARILPFATGWDSWCFVLCIIKHKLKLACYLTTVLPTLTSWVAKRITEFPVCTFMHIEWFRKSQTRAKRVTALL